MQRDYMNFVNVACKEGMKPEEVQNLFNNIYNKSNTKMGRKVLRLFAKGIGNVKKKSLIQQKQVTEPQIEQEFTQEKARQFIYK